MIWGRYVHLPTYRYLPIYSTTERPIYTVKPTRAYNETFLGLHSSGPAGRLGLDVSNHDDITVSPLFVFLGDLFPSSVMMPSPAYRATPGHTDTHTYTHELTNKRWTTPAHPPP